MEIDNELEFESIYRESYQASGYKKNEKFSLFFQNLNDEGKNAAIVNDIFANLLCFPGELIMPKGQDKDKNGFRIFSVSSKVPNNYINIISECLETVKLHAYLEDALQSCPNLQFGKVNQAYSQYLNSHMEQYMEEILNLRLKHAKEGLTLIQLREGLVKMTKWLNLLVKMTKEINSSFYTGGMTFSFIHEELTKNAGNIERYEFLIEFANAVSKPFFEILNEWIFCGILNDPKSEFFIQCKEKADLIDGTLDEDFSDIISTENMETCENWTSRFIIDHTQLPRFFEKSAEVILKTGIYIKIIRQCGADLNLYKDGLLLYSHESEVCYMKRIQEVYRATSAFLLDLLVTKYSLLDHISSLKDFILLNQRDFLTNFLESAPALFEYFDSEYPPMEHFQNLLENAIGISSNANHPLAKKLRAHLSSVTIIGEFVGLKKVSDPKSTEHSMIEFIPRTYAESFFIDYQINWPMNLVLSEGVMRRSRLLFRHIFQCVITEYKLSSIWALNKSIRGSLSKYSSFFLPALILGQQMINFNNQYQMFLHAYVIEPAFHELSKKLKSAKTLEDVMNNVDDCIQTCFDESVLRKDHLIGALSTLNDLCTEFGDFIDSLLISFDETMAEVGTNNLGAQETLRHQTPHGMRRGSSINSLISINTNTYQIGIPAKASLHHIFPQAMTQARKREIIELKRKVMEKSMENYATSSQYHMTVSAFNAKFIYQINELLTDLNQFYGKHCTKLKILSNLIDANKFYSEAAKNIVIEKEDSQLGVELKSDRIDNVALRDNIFQSSFVQAEQEIEKTMRDINLLCPTRLNDSPINVENKLENVTQWLSETRYSKTLERNNDDDESEENVA